jgi:hypothetical protein
MILLLSQWGQEMLVVLSQLECRLLVQNLNENSIPWEGIAQVYFEDFQNGAMGRTCTGVCQRLAKMEA